MWEHCQEMTEGKTITLAVADKLFEYVRPFFGVGA